jgi:hypothetical protein
MKIKNIAQYCELMLDEGSDWIYRGQPDDYSLLPSIGRDKYKNLSLQYFESNLVDEFNKRASRFANFPSVIIETLIYAQHYGLPTRLLDWTENPLAALWFAISKNSLEKVNPVVWKLYKNGDIIYSRHDKEIWKNIFEYHDLIDIDFPIIYYPDHFDDRIINQQSVVTIHPIIEDRIIELNKFDDESIRLIKIEIDKDSCFDMQKELNTLGINFSRIYPGIEGVCKRNKAWIAATFTINLSISKS